MRSITGITSEQFGNASLQTPLASAAGHSRMENACWASGMSSTSWVCCDRLGKCTGTGGRQHVRVQL